MMKSSFRNSIIIEEMFCADKLVAETHPGIHPSSGTCPLARGGFCLEVNIELAWEPSKWSIKAAVEATSWVLWDAAVTLARVGRVGWEIPVVYLYDRLYVYKVGDSIMICSMYICTVICMERWCILVILLCKNMFWSLSQHCYIQVVLAISLFLKLLPC